jgi:hypothetical protein
MNKAAHAVIFIDTLGEQMVDYNNSDLGWSVSWAMIFDNKHSAVSTQQSAKTLNP